ncbi:U7-hexatoxin-Hi1a-like [Brevipalpus obovatus]|uniref:U7-hexatoxin-Hi1a-like n=1 Tax=Brevipalpus obovatus TaxID=246614 RepID=UPI003D9FA900
MKSSLVIVTVLVSIISCALASKMVGGWTEMSAENKVKYTKLVQDHYNRNGNAIHQAKVIEVIEALQQLVNGLNIRFKVKMAHTECKKNDSKKLELCAVNQSEIHHCNFEIYRSFTDNTDTINNFKCQKATSTTTSKPSN